ncbi:MAG TPA: ricin-type beta-trefoil lectin domain protein [Candidatus Saccharimonadales bacterium]|nr:ricin-type beta-trefoil lectin domain protein [Candidatus Saccharimonadales bacterium]
MLTTVIRNLKQGSRRTLLAISAAIVGVVAPIGVFVSSAAAVAPNAPVNLRAWVGGDSIALTWNPASEQVPTSYDIYRDGSYYESVAPVTDNAGGNTQRYIDDSVTNGQTYNYYVVSLNAASEASSPSNTVTVTQPANPVPVPNITIAPNRPANVLPVLQAGKDLLEDWYPKIVTKLGNTSGSPSSFTITSAPNTNTAAYVIGTTMTVDEGWAIANAANQPSDLFIHEGTHIASNGIVNTPSWIVEGIADYIKYYMYGSNVAPVPSSFTYLHGYEHAGYMFNYIETAFNKPNFVKDLYANRRTAGNDISAFIESQTGTANGYLTLGELWYNMTGKKVSSVLTLKNAATANSCADVWSSNDADNATVDIYTCNDSVAQQWTFVPFNNTTTEGFVRTNLGGATTGSPVADGSQRCLHAKSNATANGTDVVLYNCNTATAGMKWIIQTNGTIKNVQSGRCLQPQGAVTTAGTILEIVDCNGSVNAQKWGVRPLDIMQSTATATTSVNYCLGSSTGATVPAAFSYLQDKACTYNVGQRLEFFPTTPGGNDGTYRVYTNTGNPSDVRCLGLNGGSTANNTRVVLTACDGSTSQRWMRYPSMRLANVASGTCLQLEGNSTAVDAYMVINTCNTTAYQKFNWATM